jgi:hypothetical protein
LLTARIRKRFFVNFRLAGATVLRKVVVIVALFFSSLRIKMSFPFQDGVAEDAALLQSDPLPVTDADPMEGDGFSYHVEGSGGTNRAYRYLKRPKAAIKKQHRDSTVNSRTSQASVVSDTYVNGTRIVRK